MSLNAGKMPKLGFGLMRLPTVDGKVDVEQVKRMTDAYMSAGFNYFDTAYVYHGGFSEKVVKETLTERYPRESFYLATKLPAWCLKEKADRDRIFAEQLERCGVEYFDFYLLHAVEDGSNGVTYEQMDCYAWAAEKKAEGRIRNFGFSFHGTPAYLEELLDRHPEVDFVQIQLNYLDWENPEVCSGRLYEILTSRDLPIIVMEPVKGGTLAVLPPELEEMIRSLRPGSSPASWALRFVGSLPGVTTILSGMSSEEQMADNLATFRSFEPLSDEERAALDVVRTELPKVPQIGCTACRYCVDGCPMSIPIPGIFKIANFLRRTRRGISAKQYYAELTRDTGRASDCVACGQCENVCPQHLPVIELLKECSEKLE